MRRVNIELLEFYMWKRKIKNKAALARATGVTRITINNLFAGKPPKHETVSGLIEALGIPTEKVGEVFYEKEEPVGQTDSSE